MGAIWGNSSENRMSHFGGVGHSLLEDFAVLYWEISYTGGFLYIIPGVLECFSLGSWHSGSLTDSRHSQIGAFLGG